MARIEPVDQPNIEQSALLAKSLHGPDGNPLNVFATLVRWPELMRRINALGGFFLVASSLNAREREIGILRTAGFTQCSYEIAQHRWLGAEAGLSGEEIEAAIDSGREQHWNQGDTALLAFVDELLHSGTIGETTWNGCAAYFDDTRRAELLALVGFYRMLAGVLNGLAVDIDASVPHGPVA